MQIHRYLLPLLLALAPVIASAQQITNNAVTVRAVGAPGRYAGFEVLHKGRVVATMRLSSGSLLVAGACTVEAKGRTLAFTGLRARPDTGLRMGDRDRITVTLTPGDPYPKVGFDLTVAAFDPVKWQAAVGKQPFHFLALYLPGAEVWHHRGWLNATPLADPFPLLLDTHVGTPEISGYHYNRNWSYTPPLGAHPIPVIGLWAPRAKRYAGLEFQTTRLRDNSERDIATGYCWVPSPGAGKAPGQFTALVYPYGGSGYQSLVFPTPGAHLASRGTLLWSDDLPATDDPNRLFFTYLWARDRDRLPRVPATVDLSWLPGGLHLPDFEGPPDGGLISGVEGSFQTSGSRLISGWRWHNESPTQVAIKRVDGVRLNSLKVEGEQLLRYAKRFRVDGEECVYWEKPLVGAWTTEWGGPAATTLHNANGFAAGRLLLGLYRDYGRTDLLRTVDGVLNWAKRVVWTRNEFADVPSSPFAIGGTLSASFCLDYYMTFRDAPDARHRAAARTALVLARTFTYRYMVLWPSDNNRFDNLDSTFLWEPNSGRDWTGAACANEVFWNLDTLAQTAVHTGDPILMWALQGSLDRWHALYQERYLDSLADYQPADMTEGFGLYAGNVYGVGARAAYGFASPLAMTEPVGSTVVRVLAGERAAMAFNRDGVHTSVRDYRYMGRGRLAFTLEGTRSGFDLSLTVPYVDLSHQAVAVVRAGQSHELEAGRDFVRPAQALWSLPIRNLNAGDRVILGGSETKGPALPSVPPLTRAVSGASPSISGFRPLALPYDAIPETRWSAPDGWAGLPRGTLWAHGVPFVLVSEQGASVVTRPIAFARPVRAFALAIAYSAGEGARPSLILADGTRQPVSDDEETLAWRAWPPIFTTKLISNVVVTAGTPVTGLDPGGRTVWAVTALTSPGDDGGVALRTAHEAGVTEWQRIQREERAIAELAGEIASLREGSVALLPPSPGGLPVNLLMRARLSRRGTALSAEQLIDPAVFNAKRFPVALYAGGEDYLHTVRTSGDAAVAILRYVREGGTLLLVSPQPWPMCYATGPGFHRSEPLTERLGLPLYNGIEAAPNDTLTVEMAPGQTVLPGLPARFAYPAGDPRLRSVDRGRLPAGARYTPLYTVQGAGSKSYGDAAGLVELPGGQGRILYLSGVLFRGDTGAAVSHAAIRFLIAAARRTAL